MSLATGDLATRRRATRRRLGHDLHPEPAFVELSAEPERAARIVADRGYPYDYSLQSMREIPYARWRNYDPEDAVRFYALRLREAGMIKSSPNKILADGADWRFWNELKRELKS